MDVIPENKSIPADIGKVISVRGSVVDIGFDNHLPPVYTLLRTGKDDQIAIEVLSQLNSHSIRGIALTPTQGLARGMPVNNTAGPIKAPVGKGIFSRMFDVFGNTIDRQGELSDIHWRSIHQDPPPLDKRSTKSEVFETGIKLIDVLVPFGIVISTGIYYTLSLHLIQGVLHTLSYNQ